MCNQHIFTYNDVKLAKKKRFINAQKQTENHNSDNQKPLNESQNRLRHVRNKFIANTSTVSRGTTRVKNHLYAHKSLWEKNISSTSVHKSLTVIVFAEWETWKRIACLKRKHYYLMSHLWLLSISSPLFLLQFSEEH